MDELKHKIGSEFAPSGRRLCSRQTLHLIRSTGAGE